MAEPLTGVFDAGGRQLTRRELLGLAAAAEMVPVRVELLDSNGERVTTFAPEFRPDVAASITAARIMGPDET